MDDYLQIMSLAAPLLGTQSVQESALYTLIVRAVQEEIAARLRQDADPEECAESVTLATVLLTVSMIRQLKDSDITDFTAGTLKVSLRDDHSAYAQMADRLLAPWRADTIAFRGVSG